MGYKNILYERKENIAYITLNRPDKLNAVTRFGPDSMSQEFKNACFAARDDEQVRVIVIKGAGSAFTAGFDLSEGANRRGMSEPTAETTWDIEQETISTFWSALWENPKPSIAQIHGYCFDLGLNIASLADLAIAEEGALFADRAPRYGGVQLFAQPNLLLGIRKAKEFLFTGNMFTAQEMLRIGFLNKVVPKENLEAEVNRLAQSIVLMPHVTTKFSKLAVNALYEEGMGLKAQTNMHVAYISMIYSMPNEFKKAVLEKGLKAALAERDEKFRALDPVEQEARAKRSL